MCSGPSQQSLQNAAICDRLGAIQGRFGSRGTIRQGWRLGFGAIRTRPLSPCTISMCFHVPVCTERCKRRRASRILPCLYSATSRTPGNSANNRTGDAQIWPSLKFKLISIQSESDRIAIQLVFCRGHMQELGQNVLGCSLQVGWLGFLVLKKAARDATRRATRATSAMVPGSANSPGRGKLQWFGARPFRERGERY